MHRNNRRRYGIQNDCYPIAIIGAGIAGLAAGCYAQMNGYRTTMFELHDLPGGLCTAWERKGYTFDGCIHYLYGSGRGQPFHQLWEELGGRLYKSEQEQVADQVLAELEKRYSSLTAQIEEVDVATPLSYERYTGNWHGSTCGWLLTKQIMRLMLRGVRKTLPGLSNFFMAGSGSSRAAACRAFRPGCGRIAAFIFVDAR